MWCNSPWDINKIFSKINDLYVIIPHLQDFGWQGPSLQTPLGRAEVLQLIQPILSESNNDNNVLLLNTLHEVSTQPHKPPTGLSHY